MSTKYAIGTTWGSMKIVKECEKKVYSSKCKIRNFIIECSCGEKEKISVSTLRRRLKKGTAMCLKCSLKKRTDPRWVNMSGKVFGNLTVLEDHIKKGNNYYWLCECWCGIRKRIFAGSLTSGNSKTCGCGLKKEKHLNGQWTGHMEISGTIWGVIRRNAVARNLEFSISIEESYNLYLKQNRMCAISGLPISFKSPRTASLDRINSNIGYNIENVQWINADINRMKWDFSQEYFLKMCKLISENNTENE